MASGEAAQEPLECKTFVLRVSIHCEGCKKKVKKILQSIDGVYKFEIDALRNRVSVAGDVDANFVIAKLRKSGKQAELWPEDQKQKQPTNQCSETQSQKEEPSKPEEPTEKPGSGDAEPKAAEPSAAPQKSTGESTKPTLESEGSKSTAPEKQTNANANATAIDETKKVAVTPQSNGEAKKKGKKEQEEKPIDAKVVQLGQDSYVNNVTAPAHLPTPQPVHVMSYNMVRPSTSMAYYAPAPTQMPMAMPTALPDYTYSPYYYEQPKMDYYYGTSSYEPYEPNTVPPPPPPQDSPGDLFNDENANSCNVM